GAISTAFRYASSASSGRLARTSRLPRSLYTAGSWGRSETRRRCSSIALPRLGGTAASAATTAAATQAIARPEIQRVRVRVRTIISFFSRARAGDGTRLELELAVLLRQAELHLVAAGLLTQGRDLPGQVFFEAVEVELRPLSRPGGQPLIEGLDRFGIEAAPERDPRPRIVPPLRLRRVVHAWMAPLLAVAETAVEQLVVAVEPGFQIAEAVVVQRRRDLLVAEIADLGLDAVAQVLRRYRKPAVEEPLAVDLELPDVLGDLIQGLAHGRSEAGGGRRGGSSRRAGRSRALGSPWHARALSGPVGELRQPGRCRSGARGSLGVHESPMIPSTGTGNTRRLRAAGTPNERRSAPKERRAPRGLQTRPIIRASRGKGPSGRLSTSGTTLMPTGRILIVEDRDSLRRMLERALGQEGYEVASAADAPEGIRRAGESAWDLVLTDLKLPDGSGIDVLAASRRAAPRTPVIVLTGYGSVATA